MSTNEAAKLRKIAVQIHDYNPVTKEAGFRGDLATVQRYSPLQISLDGASIRITTPLFDRASIPLSAKHQVVGERLLLIRC